MYYSGIKYGDMINGEGIRVSLFVSGCSHRCRGCFNRETWNPEYGKIFSDEEKKEIFAYFEKYSFVKGLSLLGGDPTYHQNIEPLISFLKEFKEKFPNKTIWIWSGYIWEKIIEDKKKKELIELCDILIDGKFDIENKDLELKWRGSSNQRVIDIKKSIENKEIVLKKID